MSINEDSHALRAGLYGCGAPGRLLLDALDGSPSVSICAIAGPAGEKPWRAAAQHSIARVHEHYGAMLQDKNLDLIILATPLVEREDRTRTAIEAGKHVLAQAPLASEVDRARAILERAAAKGTAVVLFDALSYSPVIEGIRLFASSRIAGQLTHVLVENRNPRPTDSQQNPNPSARFDNLILEQAVPFFAWTQTLLGEAVAVAALGDSRDDPGRAFASVLHSGGAASSHYHEVVERPETARTRLVVSFERVDLIAEGHIPARLHLEGQAAGVGTTTIRRMLSRGIASIPDQRLGFIFDAGSQREIQLHCLQSAARELNRAVREPSQDLSASASFMLGGLQTAVAARRSAHMQAVVSLRTPGKSPQL